MDYHLLNNEQSWLDNYSPDYVIVMTMVNMAWSCYISWSPWHDLTMIIPWRVWITMIKACHSMIVMFNHGCQPGMAQRCISGAVKSYLIYFWTHLCPDRNANFHIWESNLGMPMEDHSFAKSIKIEMRLILSKKTLAITWVSETKTKTKILQSYEGLDETSCFVLLLFVKLYWLHSSTCIVTFEDYQIVLLPYV